MAESYAKGERARGQGRAREGAVLEPTRAEDVECAVPRAEDATPATGGYASPTAACPPRPAPTRRCGYGCGSTTRASRTSGRTPSSTPTRRPTTFGLEFTPHEGRTGDRARAAKPGDTGKELLKRLEDLPGFGKQKVWISLARFHFLPFWDGFSSVTLRRHGCARNVWAGRLSV
ncbi:hypothetical protein [Streptomyces incanus]|uniref:Uncharacterized protein n=1 Tax=Streptomyces incanus TaxID=887453 RepID=A0ABW0XKQ4_9ACTN